MELFGKNIKNTELMKRIGDISQLGGINFFEYTDGLKKGIRAADIKCPCGIDITVLLDRGMDISNCFFKNAPICWRSAIRETSPYFYDNRKNEWLRSFFGGLLTTCGFDNTGMDCKDEEEELGLHGRISNLSAEQVNSYSLWEDDDYRLSIEGKVRSAKVFGNKLELNRKITTYFLKPVLVIEDCVTNIGFSVSPIMLLYHINFGYPLIDTDAEIIEGKAEIKGKDKLSDQAIDSFKSFSKPVNGFKEMAYYHNILPDKQGYSNIAIINKYFNKNAGIGVWIRFKKENLPYLLQWKQMGEGEYVCGLEPANCLTRGRAKERQEGGLKFINPGESLNYRIEMHFLSGSEEIYKVDNIIKSL